MSVGLVDLNPVAEKVCYNASEWITVSQEFHNTALQFGYICLFIGCIIGVFAGYFYCKRKYGSSQ